MSNYEILEDAFYANEQRIMNATFIDNKIIFTASKKHLRLIETLTENEKIALYNVLTVDGILDKNANFE